MNEYVSDMLDSYSTYGYLPVECSHLVFLSVLAWAWNLPIDFLVSYPMVEIWLPLVGGRRFHD